ncbi:MAG: hypothetical protein [Microviridae sp.]|nr:MAG: hypothetical protein [Microviridae sp.]
MTSRATSMSWTSQICRKLLRSSLTLQLPLWLFPLLFAANSITTLLSSFNSLRILKTWLRCEPGDSLPLRRSLFRRKRSRSLIPRPQRLLKPFNPRSCAF